MDIGRPITIVISFHLPRSRDTSCTPVAATLLRSGTEIIGLEFVCVRVCVCVCVQDHPGYSVLITETGSSVVFDLEGCFESRVKLT